MWTTIIDFLLLGAAAALLIPVITIALQVVCSFVPHCPTRRSSRARESAAIIIPAHNESTAIEQTLASVKAQMRPGDRLIVVADNCTDDTADVARSLGAAVVERKDPSKNGKAYALEAGMRFLWATGERSVVVFVDADCILGGRALDKLVRACSFEDAPIQGRDVMNRAGRGDIRQRISTFAWRVKNEVRPLGYRALGLPCLLMGTGMAMPSHILRRINLATDHITEDITLGVRCALLGRAPLYCPEAIISSEFAPSDTGRDAQKSRWIHGHLATILEFVPVLVKEGARRRQPVLWAIAADLMVPPLGLLGAGTLGLNVLTILWWFAGGGWAPILLAAIVLLLSILTLAIAWVRSGRDLIALSEFAALPLYVMRQLVIGKQFFTGHRSGWIRSERK